MASIKIICPNCKKLFESDQEFTIDGNKVYLGKCGHIISQELMDSKNPQNISSLRDQKLFPYQCEGVKFIENANGRALIADEMGLGKTVQALGFLSIHPEQLPALYIVKASLKRQWQREHSNWIGEDSIAQIIDSRGDIFFPNIDAYIISYDLLWRIGKDRLTAIINERGIKTVILDECQQIKNLESKRTCEVMEVCKLVPNVIALSGTPIKNSINEYFPILNILNPAMFPAISKFQMNWCDSYYDYAIKKYRTGGLKNPAEFMKRTKDFIIRRERLEVMKELPAIFRQFSFHDLADTVKQAYEDYMEKFLEEYDGAPKNNKARGMNMLAYMSKMRHLTGLSKIDPAIDITMQVIGSTERKVCLFCHHQDVEFILEGKLNSILIELGFEKCVSICQKSSDVKDKLVQEFINDPKKRILIASSLSSGEGLDGLQKIDAKCIQVERQWNPANEEQIEGRFSRIGSVITEVDSLYLVAIGTIDEFFSSLVERKRAIVNSALKGIEMDGWNEAGILKELADILALKGRKAYSFRKL